MRSLRWLSAICAVGTFVGAAGCSLVLSPSRRHGEPGNDAGTFDGGTRDAGSGDASIDAAIADGGVTDTGTVTDGGTDAGVSDAGPPDAGPLCADGQVCGLAAPAGWTGPVIVVSGPGDAAAPICPSTAAVTAFTAHAGMSAAAASCACACGAARGTFSCGAAPLYGAADRFCASMGASYGTFGPGECRSVALNTSGGWSLGTSTLTVSGGADCAPSATITIPPLTWAESVRACGFGAATSCGASGVCAPIRGAGERLCVYVPGEAACPPTFPDLLLTAESATDTRGCEPCSCGGVRGSCTGRVDLTSSCGSSTSLGQVPLTGCSQASAVGTVAVTGNYRASVSCTPSGGAVVGGATPTIPRTICCVAD